MISKSLSKYIMPHESSCQKLTWMGFPSNSSVWEGYLKSSQTEIIIIAKTIAKYQPVNLIIDSNSALLKAQQLINKSSIKSKYEINFMINPIDDIWLRDSGPAFVFDEQKNIMGVDLNFNGWGNKQPHIFDKNIAKYAIKSSQVPLISSDIITEGGAIEVDGEGTALITESSMINDNRNPGKTKQQIEEELFRVLGIEKVIWLPGVKGLDITDAHIDLYARFIGPNFPAHVFVHLDPYDKTTEENLKIIRNSYDAKGRRLIPVVINCPNYAKIRKSLTGDDDCAVGYCNYYVCNGAVLVPSSGDKKTDDQAYRIFSDYFPNRVVELLNIDNIVNFGGSIHCVTQQQIDIISQNQ